MSYTLDSLLDQAIDNYPVTATLSPEVVAVMFYALSQIQDPETWLDYSQDPLDNITPTEYSEILELVSAANMAIITPEVGFIKPYITTNPPDNTIPCDGGTYAREDYPLLYAVIDSVFIVDADTFTVPNLSGLALIGAGTNGTHTFALGDTGGEYEHTLDVGEIATHSHGADAPTVIDPTHVHGEVAAIPTLITIGAGVPAPSAVPSPSFTAPALTGITVLAPTIHDTGSSNPHNNIQPYGVVKYCVQAR
jgi:microcystin-dependent protein